MSGPRCRGAVLQSRSRGSTHGGKLDRVDAVALAVVERDGHHAGLAGDPDDAKELVSLGWGTVGLQAVGDPLELDPGAKGVVQLGRAERARVQRARPEIGRRAW